MDTEQIKKAAVTVYCFEDVHVYVKASGISFINARFIFFEHVVHLYSPDDGLDSWSIGP